MRDLPGFGSPSTPPAVATADKDAEALPASPVSSTVTDTATYPWRTEPEITPERQRYLAARRALLPNSSQGSYPFSGVALTRADIEWLLATHEDGRGPVDWADPQQRRREGLDLRGALLAQVDLHQLPLACLRGGLTEDQWRNAQAQTLEAAAIHLEHADLSGTHLEGAILEGAHLEEARLRDAWLESANLSFAHLEGASLSAARLTRAVLLGAALDGANLSGAHLAEADLASATLSGAELFGAHLEGARLGGARLGGVALSAETCARVRRWRADFPATLPGADISGIFCDSATAFDDAILGDPLWGSVALADARWGDVNLAVIDWASVTMLGDEREAQQQRTIAGDRKDTPTRLAEFRIAVRANRQLAVALRDQGLNEEADRFAYRAQVLQRAVLLRQALAAHEAAVRMPRRAGAPPLHRRLWQRTRQLAAYALSLFLDLLSGYGYRPERSLAAYILSLLVFAVLFYLVGQIAGPALSPVAATALSISSFHGRGFFPGTVTPGDPVTLLAAAEAIAGLVIEISFIATFTQRFFGR